MDIVIVGAAVWIIGAAITFGMMGFDAVMSLPWVERIGCALGWPGTLFVLLSSIVYSKWTARR